MTKFLNDQTRPADSEHPSRPERRTCDLSAVHIGNRLLESFGGRSISGVKTYFADRDAKEWHRAQEWLPLEEGIVMSLLPGALRTFQATRALFGANHEDARPTLRARHGQLALRSDPESPTVQAFPIASVYFRRALPSASFHWLHRDDEFGSLADQETRRFHAEVLYQASQVRICGLDDESCSTKLRPGVVPGQERVSLISEVLSEPYCPVPIPSHGQRLADIVWVMVPLQQLSELTGHRLADRDPLVDIHSAFWGNFHYYCTALGSRWCDAVESLGESLGLEHGTCIEPVDRRTVWLRSLCAKDPHGKPLTLVFTGPQDPQDLCWGSPRDHAVTLAWQHHTGFVAPP